MNNDVTIENNIDNFYESNNDNNGMKDDENNEFGKINNSSDCD